MRETLVKTEEFKDSPLGKIPKDWDVVPLSSVFQIQSGATPLRTKHQSYFVGGTIPWVKTMDLNEGWIVDTDERITEIALKECSVQLLPPKTVLIAMYGGWEQIGRTGILKDSASTNQAISSLIKISPLVEPEFVLRALQYGRFRWKGIAASTRKDPNITRDDVVNFLIPLPPLDEQRHIAEILDTVDETIAHTTTLIAKLKLMKAGLLHDLLTRGLDENRELRDAIGHPEQFKESPLGQIPKDWCVGKLDNLAINHDGRRIPLKQSDRDKMEGIYPYYGASGVIDWVDSYLFEGDYVLLGEDGENVVSRQLPLAFRARGRFWVNNHAHIYEPLPNVDIRFLNELLEFTDYSALVSGSAQPKLTQDALNRLYFRIPKPKEQVLIADIVNTYNTRIRTEEAYRDKLKLQKQGMMHDLLTGKVRVKDLDKFTPASDTV